MRAESSFTQRDVTHIAKTLARAEQNKVMPRSKALTDGDIRHTSSRFDPVTAADEAAERVI